MNQNLDNPQNFMMADQENHVLSSIKLLADQIEDARQQAQNLNSPADCHLTQNITLCGMGGSALGARIIQSTFASILPDPLIINTNFSLPHYIGANSLVIISSYSGNTAEAINCLYKAQSAGAKIFAITTGGKLAEEIEHGLPGIIIDPKNNPSNQPRLGLGYSFGAMLSLMSNCQILSLTDLELNEAIKHMRQSLSAFAPDKPTSENKAKKLAVSFKAQAPIIIASEHLIGAAHAMKNQLNETAKTFSALFDLPELNHHLMEGLKHPAMLKSNLKFLFLESNLYSNEVTKRYPLTAEVLNKNELEVDRYELTTSSKLGQALEVVALGAYLSFYLAYLKEEDPSQIPWVDYFKERLQ